MTTSSSSWRSSNVNNGPRWSQAAGNSTHQSVGSPASAAAASVPRSSNNALRLPETDSSDADTIQHDRMMYLFVGLVGNTVVATTRSGIKYIGILSSTTVPEDGAESLGVVLSCAQQIVKEGGLGALKKLLIIKGDDLDSLIAKDVGLDVPVSMSNANRAGFRTDTEISKKALEPFGEGRSLQKWADDTDSFSIEDERAFADMATSGGGSGTGKGGWDQFAANEARFGVKSNYEETLYTTKLDKSAKDYKDRERKADQLAREIMNSTTSNTHIAEERNSASQGEEGQTEEDRFGAVVRGPNAYLPPAARRAAAVAAAAGAQNTIKANGTAREDKANGVQHMGVDIPIITNTPAAATVDATGSGQQPQQTPDAVGDFRQFVSSERERMEKKKAALAKKEKDNKLADLKNWGDKFKLNFPLSNEAAAAKDDQEAVEKPRDISLQKSMSPTTAHLQKQSRGAEEETGISSLTASSKVATAKAVPQASTHATQAKLAETKALLAKMTIPLIPPFNPEKLRARQSEAQFSPANAAMAANKSSFKLSAKASSFKPFNPNAASFTPGASAAAVSFTPVKTQAQAVASPAPVTAAVPAIASLSNTPSESTSEVNSPRPVIVGKTAATPVNPFFGNRILKKTTPLHVREDFNPFKNGKVPESQIVGPTWGFTGKGYRTLFQVVSAEEGGSMPSHLAHLQQHPQHQSPLPPNMTPLHNMLPMGAHPTHAAHQHGMMGQQGQMIAVPPPPPHLQQQQQQQQINQAGMAPNNGQAFYIPYGAAQGSPYRFQGGQQPMQQMQAGFGQMPSHYLPFSPSIPPNAQPVYSPQMGNMFPSSASMHNMGMPPGQVVSPMSRNGGGPPMQQQGKVPPHMYYANAPYPPNSTGPMSPSMRHQQPQHQSPYQQQQPYPPSQTQQQQQQQQQQQTVHSGTTSQSGSVNG